MTDLTCDITYAVDQSDPDGAPYTFCKLLGTDTHLKVKPIPTLVKDIRPAFEQGEGPKLGVEGFEAVRHVYEGELDGDQGWENIYARKMAQVSALVAPARRARADPRHASQWLQTHLGATRVAQYGATMRRRIAEDGAWLLGLTCRWSLTTSARTDPAHPKEFDTGKLQPATVAHCDGSQFSANKRARDTLGLSEEEAKGKRIAIINVWRPLAGPVVDSPLALCDARTVVEEDYTITQ